MTLDHETRYIVLAPDCTMTPDQLVRTIHTIDADVIVKETCFGAVISGKIEAVRKVLTEVRKMDPNRIYSKIRAFPMGDSAAAGPITAPGRGSPSWRRKWKDLCLVEKGLICVEKGEKAPIPRRRARCRSTI